MKSYWSKPNYKVNLVADMLEFLVEFWRIYLAIRKVSVLTLVWGIIFSFFTNNKPANFKAKQLYNVVQSWYSWRPPTFVLRFYICWTLSDSHNLFGFYFDCVPSSKLPLQYDKKYTVFLGKCWTMRYFFVIIISLKIFSSLYAMESIWCKMLICNHKIK